MTRDETPNPPPPPRDLLAVDVGNSRVKLGWFPGVDGECLDRAQSATLPIAGPRTPEPIATLAGSLEELTGGRLAEWLGATAEREHPPAIVIASVCGPADRDLADLLGGWFGDELAVQRLASERLPIALRVEEPERIGVDRVVAAIAANLLRRPETPAIVIDIGTAITVDLVSADGALEGGAILPGPRLAAAALGEATDRLPQVDFGDLDASPDAVGRSTEPAIRAGLYWGSVGAVRELIARQSDRLTKTPQVFVTGGAAPAFARLLGGPDVSVRHVPHLTLSGVAIAAGASS